MSNSRRRIGMQYGFAIVSVAVVALHRWLLQPAMADAAPLILFVLPIVLAGWYGGIGPALLATVLGTLAGTYLFLPANRPGHHLEWSDLPWAMASLLVGIVLSICEGCAYRMRKRLALRTIEVKHRQDAARRARDTLSRAKSVEQAQRELEE